MSNSTFCMSINVHFFLSSSFLHVKCQKLAKPLSKIHHDRLDLDVLGSRSTVPKISPDTSSRSSLLKSLGRSHCKSKALPLAFVAARVSDIASAKGSRSVRGGSEAVDHGSDIQPH